MFDFSDPQTYWLNVVNIVLGLVTFACLVAVGSTFGREILGRMRQRVPSYSRRDEHTFILPDLGITMADGGERIDETKSHQPPPVSDESNIYRSNN